jgi:hypothetical protein
MLSLGNAGYGSVHAADLMGQKRARELWFVCRFNSTQQAVDWDSPTRVLPTRNLVQDPVRGGKERALQDMLKTGTRNYERKLTWKGFLHTGKHNDRIRFYYGKASLVVYRGVSSLSF